VVRAADPLQSLISVFLTGAATFLSSSSSFIVTRLSGPCSRPTATLLLLVAPGIELEASGSAARNSDH
jgi:hypothetical protein